MNTIHPDRLRLSSFALGQLAVDDARAVADHVAGCPECEAIVTAVPDDALLALIRLVKASGKLNSSAGDDPLATGPKAETAGVAGRAAETPDLAQDADTDDANAPVIPGYEDLVLLGKGGMGTVYLARDPRLKREVALKVLRRLGDPEADRRFQSEAEAVARLQHPHIVQIFEIGRWQPLDRSEPALFVALEYVPDGSLASVLRQGPLAVAEAAALLEVLARAMQAAHEAGIVHRDLKPANVLLGGPVPGNSGSLSFGFPKIADFGLARQLDSRQRQTVAGHLLGTPAYMAPEQAEGRHDVGPPADVWALGVILYQCLTGELPFQGPGIRATLTQVCVARPTPPRERRAGIPAELEAICLRCLEKDLAARYPSAAALADDLARFRSGGRDEPKTAAYPPPLPDPVGGKEPPRSRPSGLPDRSGRGLAVLASVSVLAVAAVLVASLLVWREWQARTTPADAPVVEPRERSDAPVVEPLEGSVDVLVYESARPPTEKFEQARRRQAIRLKDRLALPLRKWDWIRIEAKMNRPAYLYVLWIRADGQVDPLWPWITPDPERATTWTDPRGAERPRQELKLPKDAYPDISGVPLGEEPPGVVTLLLLAREQPLSDAEVTELADLLASWKRKPATDEVFAVWLENARFVDRIKLGKGGDISSAEEQTLTVMRQIHERFGYVRGVCFSNQGKGQP